MANVLSNLTLEQLQAAVDLKRQIAVLEQELKEVVGAAPSGSLARSVLFKPSVDGRTRRGRRKMSAEGRRRIAAAQRARREREQALIRSGRNPRKKLSRAARANLSAAAKLRWAKAKAAGRTSL